MMHNLITSCDRPFGIRAFLEVKMITFLYPTLLKDAKIPTRHALLLNLNGKVLDSPAPSRPPARLSRLGDLDESTPYTKNIPDTQISFRMIQNRHILTKSTNGKITALH